jgi:diguanylate cyclase
MQVASTNSSLLEKLRGFIEPSKGTIRLTAGAWRLSCLQWALGLSLLLVFAIFLIRTQKPEIVDSSIEAIFTGLLLLFGYLSLRESQKVSLDNRQLSKLLQVDPLTGVLNRKAAFEIAETEIDRSARFARPLTFVVMDVDEFKAINDQYGHIVGDSVLKHFAQAVTACLRSIDTFARIGGEEFLILLPECHPDQAMESLSAGVSGFATVCRPGSSAYLALDYFRRADQAMYLAKKAGKNQVHLAKTVSHNPDPASI